MGNEIKNQGSPVGTSGSPKSQKTTKRVEDIILDKNHPAYTGPDSMGVIFFADEKTNESTIDPTTLPQAKPLNLNLVTTPSIGDLVHIQSLVSDNYYPEMGGNSNFTSNYYTNAINIYNNAGSNAVPLNKKTKKKNKKDKTRESEPNFEFTKEFIASTRQEVNIKCDNWLIDHGYPSGRKDPKAPKYTIERASNGDYIRKLDDSKRNKVKLGLYYEENRNQQNLSPSEGSTLSQGKDGQRISKLSSGPNGSNAVSRNVTDVDDDGNTNIGDPAMILSLGRGDTENITHDAASIYMLANQGIPIDVACLLIASTKSIYEKLLDPLAAIATPPPEVISEDDLETEEPVQDVFDFDSTEELLTFLEAPPIPPPIIEEPWDDPVFAALDEAIEANELTQNDIDNYEISATEEDLSIEGEGYSSNVEFWLGGDEFPTDLSEKECSELYRDQYNAPYALRNREAVKEYNNGNNVQMCTSAGKLFTIYQPISVNDVVISSANSGNRTIEYLVIHCTGGGIHRNAAQTTNFLFNPDDPTREGAYGRLFRRPGYHYIINQYGKVASSCPEDVTPWGATGFNSNGIHLNWVGGREAKVNITSPQVRALEILINKYIASYPNIKIMGHNQAASKSCPNFYAPTFAEELGINPHNTSHYLGTNNHFDGSSGAKRLEDYKIRAKQLISMVGSPGGT